MQQGSSRKQWYALQLRTRFEKVVALHLRGKGYEEYLPTYRSRHHWSDRIKEIELPLFPGYIFCKFDVTDRFPVLVIPGVNSVVSFGGTPMPIPEQEIVAVKRIVNSGMQYGPWPGVSVGQAVQVKYGPLRGLEGTVVQVKKNYRFVISIDMLHRCVSVEIDRDCVAPVAESRAKVVGLQQWQNSVIPA
jgi:transcription antitermination factor NusG